MRTVLLHSAAGGELAYIDIKACSSRLFLERVCFRSPLRNCLASQARSHKRRLSKSSSLKTSTLASTNRDGSRQVATTAGNNQQRTRPTSSPGGNGGNDPDDDSANSSFQIGLDPFSQQLITSAVTACAAGTVAASANLDLISALRLDADALIVALQLSAPVLLLLLTVVSPRWAPPFKGSELERLRHNYYMTAQVLQLYLDFDDEVEDSDRSTSSTSGWEDSAGGGDERARVRRRLRLEQTVGWGTISSGLALLQAFALQPWNPPTANSVFGLALAGRSAQQLANEFLVRGAGWGLLSGWLAEELQSADASDGILFFGKVFGGPETVKYVAGLALVALALPGALWEARAARNFVRASVVGPVRDAAIFCTGNGVDEPAYCDPKGFAMMAARRPANAASVADVVTRTRGWRSGPDASYSSVSSMDLADLAEEGGQEVKMPGETQPMEQLTVSRQGKAAQTAAAGAAPQLSSPSSPSMVTSPPSTGTSSAAPSTPSSLQPRAQCQLPEHAATHSLPSSAEYSRTSTSTSTSAAAPSFLDGSSSSSNAGSGNSREAAGLSSTPSYSPAPTATTEGATTGTFSTSSPSSPMSSSVLPRVGPTLSTSSTAFEWDSEDMSVLLRVETFQDRIALWSSLYYQLLAAFAINGAFLASDCNLMASFVAAWLLRTGPLLLSELRARAAANAAM
ncbi:hypothetical protein VaNZ11_015985 [Volvox africanus]|uniref:Uncharacterized protein n=1 Tax=Volvox africanus TaxID=51714 RepID=A0ABQ5SNS1_9CHLO|nr:hypothetical protein VaNZ11_015985 [Volvox africanus]